MTEPQPLHSFSTSGTDGRDGRATTGSVAAFAFLISALVSAALRDFRFDAHDRPHVNRSRHRFVRSSGRGRMVLPHSAHGFVSATAGTKPFGFKPAARNAR